MPRLLPRLISRLEASPPPSTFDPFSLDHIRFRGKSLRNPVPPTPSFHPSHYKQSILLSPGNPVTSSRDYKHHKSLPPRVSLPKNAKSRKNANDHPRTMTREERGWWANPYLRMLSTPLRQCMQTERLLPSAFLIRLGVFRAPSDKPLAHFSLNAPPPAVMMPDGLEHPKFRGRKSGKAGYFLCWKDAIKQIQSSGAFRRIAWNLTIPSSLEAHVRHLLHLRVLQELRLVIDGLRYRPLARARDTLVRKLTRAEWKEFKSTGVMPVKDAMAVIVLPPLNRRLGTKERPKGSMSSLPPPEYPAAHTHKVWNPPLPMCTLHLTSHQQEELPTDIYHSQHRVPLYNGVSLFSNPEQRAMLRSLLNRILVLEAQARRRGLVRSRSDEFGVDEADQRASHAYVLMSSEQTALTADLAAVGVALWRIPMFEGMGWEEKTPWIKRYKYRSTWGNKKYEY
ncbi:hypothetical protein D9757_000161 [Collybiopsis confluens]|uniref:Uncharacterized protein n=1 Tax=Collybiopsis confluens TaxID=2823264 RepID=A0A8H5MGU6_9AGAR|nr:hypothetical protein D9757_000161 [Collybiopsis confluens]